MLTGFSQVPLSWKERSTSCQVPSLPMLQWNRESQEQESLLLHETSFLSEEHDITYEDHDEQTPSCSTAVPHNRRTSADGLPGPPKASQWLLYQGLIYSCLSSLFFSLCAVIVKYLYHIHPGQLACLRFLGILIFTLPLVIHSREDPLGPKSHRHFLILRGIVGSASLFLRFCAMHYLPIADANVIIFSVPVFVSVFAHIFLKEPCGIVQIFTIVLTLVGLGLVTKLPMLFSDMNSALDFTNNDHIWGVTAALTSTIFSASVYIVVRKVKGVHHSVIMFNFGWVAILETTILTGILGGFSLPHCGIDHWLIIVLGVFSFCGQVMLTRALQLEQAGPVSVVRAATDIIFVFLWQIIFFQEMPDRYSISGAVLVTSCVLLTSVRKWAISLPERSRLKSKLYFLTI